MHLLPIYEAFTLASFFCFVVLGIYYGLFGDAADEMKKGDGE